MLYDTHVHLDMLLQKLEILPEGREIKIQDLDESAIFTSREKTVDLIARHDLAVQSTVSTDNFLFVKSLFEPIKKIKLLLGSHPEIVNENFNLLGYLEIQKNLLVDNQGVLTGCVGIGECGLDYFYTQNSSLIKTQQNLFESQIQLCVDKNLPLVIHCRDAFSDLIAILKNFSKIHNRFLVHCFTGDLQTLKQILGLGGVVAYGGIITFGKNADLLRDTVKYCPVESLVLETDLPFLSPNPHRGQVCLPEYIDFVAQKIADLKNTTKENIWQKTRKNVDRLFNLD